MSDSKAKKDWQREHTVIITMRLNRNTDADIIARLEAEENRAGFIKELIRNAAHCVRPK